MTHFSIKHSRPELLKQQNRFKEVIPVVLTPSNSFIPYFAVTLQSISVHTDKECLYRIYVLHKDTFDVATAMRAQDNLGNNMCISFIDVTDFIKDFPFYIPLCFQDRFPIEVYFRLLIPTILSEYEKVIYLDSDLIVLTDLRYLYHINLGNNLIAGTSEYFFAGQESYAENLLHLPAHYYINDGVLLMNCTKLNEFHFMEKYLNLLSKGIPQTAEQDVINIVCKGGILYLNEKWNFRWHMEVNALSELETPYILHYLSEFKPWNTSPLLFSKYFYRYAALTSFFNAI